ncbi:MAG: AAA family ATPase [Gammaproteobacteria bacterium]
MYTSYFGFTDKPFKLKPDPRFFYSNPAYVRAYGEILTAIREHKAAAVLTAEAGTGKTTLLRRCMEGLGDASKAIWFGNTTLPLEGLLDHLCEELGIPITQGVAEKLKRLQYALASRAQEGKSTVLLIDDAHNLDSETLTELLALCVPPNADKPLLQAVLVGLPELLDKLRQAGWQRIAADQRIECRVEPLADAEIGVYINHQLKTAGYTGKDLFTPDAVRAITAYAKGVPRTINSLCDAALFIACIESERSISADTVERAAQHCFLKSQKSSREAPVLKPSARPLPNTPPMASKRVADAGAGLIAAADHKRSDPRSQRADDETVNRAAISPAAAAARLGQDPTRPRRVVVDADYAAAPERRPRTPLTANLGEGQRHPITAPVRPGLTTVGTRLSAPAKRKQSNALALTVALLLVLMGGAGAAIWYKPELVSLSRADVDSYVELARERASEYADVAWNASQPYLDKARDYTGQALDASQPYLDKARAYTGHAWEVSQPYVDQALTTAHRWLASISGERKTYQPPAPTVADHPKAQNGTPLQTAKIEPEPTASAPDQPPASTTANATTPETPASGAAASMAPQGIVKPPGDTGADVQPPPEGDDAHGADEDSGIAGSGAANNDGAAVVRNGPGEPSTAAVADTGTKTQTDTATSETRTASAATTSAVAEPTMPSDSPLPPATPESSTQTAATAVPKQATTSTADAAQPGGAKPVQEQPVAVATTGGASESAPAPADTAPPSVAATPSAPPSDNAAAATPSPSAATARPAAAAPPAGEPVAAAPAPATPPPAQPQDNAATTSAVSTESRPSGTQPSAAPADPQQIAVLLTRAKRQIGANRLATPPGDSALDTYRSVLEIDPNNATALAGIKALKDKYRVWAEAAARKKAWGRVQQYYERALSIDPQDAEIAAALADAKQRSGAQ